MLLWYILIFSSALTKEVSYFKNEAISVVVANNIILVASL